MTYEERLKYFCEHCHDRQQCGYVNRNMIGDCTYLQDIMGGWEAGYQDAVDETQNVDEHWQDVRERAAIAAMQGVMNFFGSIDYNRETIAKLAVEQADALIEELKKK